MRLMALKGAALLTIALAFSACSSKQAAQPGPAMSQSQTAQPGPAMSQSTAAQGTSQSAASGPSSTRTGAFEGLNGKHVAGTATVTDGQVVLSGFSSDGGPDLHIYLTNGTDENAVTAGKELGTIAFDKASQTFSTGGADPWKYTTIVINCDKAKAVFGAATLA